MLFSIIADYWWDPRRCDLSHFQGIPIHVLLKPWMLLEYFERPNRWSYSQCRFGSEQSWYQVLTVRVHANRITNIIFNDILYVVLQTPSFNQKAKSKFYTQIYETLTSNITMVSFLVREADRSQKGRIPTTISYIITPSDHQSTDWLYPIPQITYTIIWRKGDVN
jgi:hypothetical protein